MKLTRLSSEQALHLWNTSTGERCCMLSLGIFTDCPDIPDRNYDSNIKIEKGASISEEGEVSCCSPCSEVTVFYRFVSSKFVVL